MPKKTITERVLAANRENGKKSIGPRTTAGTRYNAVTHSLLAKKILFRDESEQDEFAKLVAELSRHHEPVGPTEGALVSEMAIALWRLHHLYGWELLEVSNREKAAAAIFQGLRDSNDAHALPLLAMTREGWAAQELTVRTGMRSREEEGLLEEKIEKAGNVLVEARLTSSLETLLRYGASIRRDFYKALDILHELQDRRLELDDSTPSQGEGNE